VTLSTTPGEIFGFVGPNGAGKSTFLKCVVGVVRADGGAIEVCGVDARRDPLAARRAIAYAPSDVALYDGMRVAATLRFLCGFHAGADLARGAALLERFGLPARARVRTLSHGMKRKLLLAGALACGAPLLLLDEPMEGLDPEARRSVETMLREEAARGRTVLLSSHDLASVERTCGRVAFLRAGRVVECGPIADVLARLSHVLWLRLPTAATRTALPHEPGWEWTPEEADADGSSTRWRLRFLGELGPVLQRVAALRPIALRDASGGLEEAFAALYGPEEARP
jgi:ABC-2 type transport system ATP-binding protein